MSSTQQSETVDISSLSDQEKESFLSERLKKFKFTIIICAIYGIIATIILLLAIFTSWGNKVLYNDMFAFIITFIIGTLFIIIFLGNEIYNFKPTKSLNNIGYDAQLCPDYWNLEYVKNPEQLVNTAEVNQNQFNYKCILNNVLFPPRKFKESDASKSVAQKKNFNLTSENRLYIDLIDKSQSGLNNDNDFTKFKSYSAQMSGYTYKDDKLFANNDTNKLKDANKVFNSNDIPLACDVVYPMYLSMMDKDNITANPSEPSNKYRCAYAKTCGIPWTDAGCS